MAVIRIREIPGSPNGSSAVVSFDHGEEYPIAIKDPFSTTDEEQQLEWYFEEHLRFPFTRKVQAKAAADSVITYGETLFKQVFADPEAYVMYKQRLQAGLNTLQIEIAGSPLFHALHWEALKDPKLPQPLALQATMVRQNLKPQVVHATIRSSPTINLLLVTARPFGKRDVGYRTISRPLVEVLRQANIPVRVEILRPGTYKALENHLRQVSSKHGAGYYHVIHFDVHGALLTYEQLQQQPQASRFQYNDRYARQDIQEYQGVKAFLSFESDRDNTSDLVEAAELADLLVSHQVPIAMLNACQSGKQVGASETSLGSRLMQAGVQLVLAMGYSVTVSAAELLMKTLYSQLFANNDVSVAIRHARTELYNHKERQAYFDQRIDLEDWLLPVVYQNQPQHLSVRDFTTQEREDFFARQAALTRNAPPEPRYGFVGRDLDILQIEKYLLIRRNILLLRGMGGAGKTTLLQHLGAWWSTTGFVEQIFSFGYDTQAWSRQQILVSIAQQLLGMAKYYGEFQPLSLDAQQAFLTRRLRAENHLLILDNLESITGAHLAIQHTLPPEEQHALRRFLTDLAGGRTLVLLGSRGSEDWLAQGTFGDNVYELGGLDPEAASILADRILERNNATKYRQDEDLRKLIKVLGGFPLALEVVFANLAHQTPTEVLTALQAGDVKLDIDEGKQQDKSIFEQKTKSILCCIDYSHSNLSPEAQQLLLCIAPFTSVIDQGILEEYTAQLRQQPALVALPFERWPEVLQEAANWGLLSPDPDSPRFLRLQPIFPYFLRNRLDTADLSSLRAAVETAFRLHYDQVGDALYKLLKSKEPQERQVGQVLTSLEYTNLSTALDLALAAQVSILNLYRTLSNYLNSTQEHQRGLDLGESVLKHLEAYSPEKLAGQLGAEFVGVIDDIANRQLRLKNDKVAESLYQKALAIHLNLVIFDANQLKQRSASIYHQLGRVAQEQQQWEQAEAYYQQALQIYIEYQDRYAQADTYHQLGMVAEEQRQWEQAVGYYQQALQIYIEYQDRYAQADTYHQLGIVAQEQRQWEQAERYSQQALQIYIEYQDRYAQASTYHQLGIVAREQRMWKQARDYYLLALETFVAFNDAYRGNIVLRSLARLWLASGDGDLPSAIAKILGMTPGEVENILCQLAGNDAEGQSGAS